MPFALKTSTKHKKQAVQSVQPVRFYKAFLVEKARTECKKYLDFLHYSSVSGLLSAFSSVSG